MPTIARAAISEDPLSDSPSIRDHLAAHRVSSVRSLRASVVAHAAYRQCYGRFGPLGRAARPILKGGDEYTLTTELGRIRVLNDGFIPWPEVTFGSIVEYVGLRIIEPNETFDDPYTIFSVFTLNPMNRGVDELVSAKKIGPRDDVAEGRDLADTHTIWGGQIIGGTGIKIAIISYDHDMGDPDHVRATIEEKIKEYAKEATEAIVTAFGAGSDEAEEIAGSEIVTWIARLASLGIVELLGLGDDEIGRDTRDIGTRELARLSTQEGYDAAVKFTPDGIEYTHKSDILSKNGHYVVYYRVRTTQIPPTPPPPALKGGPS